MSANAKDRSTIVSGAGFVSDFMIRLIGTVKEKGGIEQDLHILVRPEGKPILDQIAELLVEQSKQIFPSSWKALSFSIAPPPTGSNMNSLLKDWKATSELYNKDYIDPRITEANFPTDENSLPKTSCEIVLVKFGRSMTTEEALREGRAQGLRRPTIQESIVFATQYPDIQKEKTIFVPHISQVFGRHCCDQSDRHYCLFLSGSYRSRQLYLRYDDERWSRFMFVRNKPILPVND